jgi:hypothetical protein
MRIMETRVYPFNELSDSAKKYAIGKNQDINTNFEWYDFTIEQATEMMEFLGFSNVKISFSGFRSQGDGACFTGEYRYNPEWEKEFGDSGYIDKEFMGYGQELHDVQAKFAFDLCTTVANNGSRYCHENSVSVSTFLNETPYVDIDIDAESSMEAICKDIMREIYRRLGEEYDYLVSNDTIIETIEASGYEFTEQGDIIT